MITWRRAPVESKDLAWTEATPAWVKIVVALVKEEIIERMFVDKEMKRSNGVY